MNTSGQPLVDLRIGDQGRERAVGGLGEHWSAGRLNLEEFEQRTTAALAARTGEGLIVLFQDLPGALPQATPGPQEGVQAWFAWTRGRGLAAAATGAEVLLTLGVMVQPYRIQEVVYRLQSLL